jgi:drug/metabolite transporter (DMT)-like permease
MSKVKKNYWLVFVIVHVIFMGVWGAFIEIPEKNGFPATLGYVVWSITMIPASIVALKFNNWKIDFSRKAMGLGLLTGLLGAAGQLILFFTLRLVPAYLVFPVISLTPVVTVLLAALVLKERTRIMGWIGIGVAILAIFFLSYTPAGSGNSSGYLWLLLSMLPLVAWGVQGFVMRWANNVTNAESIFFYMMISSIMLSPVALLMTDFSKPINWGFNGPWLAAIVQVLNAIGALCLVYAFRYGKAIIIAPMTTALSPVLTVVLSLIIYAVIPQTLVIAGIILALVSAFMMGREDALADDPGPSLTLSSETP